MTSEYMEKYLRDRRLFNENTRKYRETGAPLPKHLEDERFRLIKVQRDINTQTGKSPVTDNYSRLSKSLENSMAKCAKDMGVVMSRIKERPKHGTPLFFIPGKIGPVNQFVWTYPHHSWRDYRQTLNRKQRAKLRGLGL